VKALAFVAPFLAALLSGGDPDHRAPSVADVTKADTITLKKNTGQGHFHFHTITCSGEI
jgi:hypothetical protein